ncbi:MAG: B12-binding domain-containing radical SAM protein, partial [Thermoanaerobaculales bacterium]|nr:B12-binding domain-containing radical SAM protein [Thermoanaerobaculales bacterium]
MGKTKGPTLVLIRVNESLGIHPFLRETNVSGVYPALGIAYLAGAARAAGFPVSVIDAHVLNLDLEGLTRRVVEFEPDVIGLTSTTFNWPVVAAVARRLRPAMPDATLIVGGPHLSLYPKESMEERVFDVAVIGEGDVVLPELLAILAVGGDVAGLPGTVVRRGDDLVHGPVRPPIVDLDGLALPAVDLLPLDRYRSLTLPRPFVSMVTSRGCPYRCRFCSQAYVGGAHREHGVDRVLEEIERAVSVFHAREIVFFDETFTLNRERVLAICEGILARNLKVSWNIRTRADLLDDEVLLALRDAGCAGVHCGIEAGSERIRTLMNKKLDLKAGSRALERARRLGMETRGYFMLGYPGETREEIEETIRLSCELPLDWASYTITIALPGTDIHSDLLESGQW